MAMKYNKFKVYNKENGYWLSIELNNGEKYYPKIMDRAIEDIILCLCEEIKYPQSKGKKGWKYYLDFMNGTRDFLLEKYYEKLKKQGISEKNFNNIIPEIIKDVKMIYELSFDPYNNTKSKNIY
jgi:hypothetical protein